MIWRNWNLVPLGRLADVLNTNASQVVKLAEQMGLKQAPENYDLWQERGYLTIIRRNWHLLPYKQLLKLLNWTPEKLAFILKEEDFLWSKMGALKPACKPVEYAPLTESELKQTRNLRKILDKYFPENITATSPPFSFLKSYGNQQKFEKTAPGLRIAYSYSAVYGDPLLNAELDPYPDSLLANYAANGINGIWLQGTLYTLIPWLGKTKYSNGGKIRLENLRKLVKRAGIYGIKLYLYLNEPRNMPEDFFRDRPEWRGTKANGMRAICTSASGVLESLQEGAAELFRQVPELAGVFTITMSENLTHCLSKSGDLPTNICSRCANRDPAEIIEEVNRAVEAGIHSVKPDAEIIVWTWGWQDPWDEKVVEMLPDNVKLMCVSETDLETDSEGIRGRVADYSISKTGPGPTASRLWKKAAGRGIQTVAKIQINNTWECSAVPYIPVPGLIRKHLENLRKIKVNDYMISWTLGGWPGGNLKFLDIPIKTVAEMDYGSEAAPHILTAWKCFDRAFENFPLHSCFQLYRGPQNFGPMNPLFPCPTGYESTMLGFPYDDLFTWRGKGHYPENIFENAFRKISEEWKSGLNHLHDAEEKISDDHEENYRDLLNVAEALYCHFRSSFLQIRFIRNRDSGNHALQSSVLDGEIELAQRLHAVILRDSRIGFEASNHYYYTANDLMEKVLNCVYLKRQSANNPGP